MAESTPENADRKNNDSYARRMGIRRPTLRAEQHQEAPSPLPDETQSQAEPVVAPAVPAPRRGKSWWIKLGVVSSAVVLVVLTGVWISSSGTYEMGGFMTLSSEPPTYGRYEITNHSIITSPDEFAEGTKRQKCWGNSGYRDIRDGADAKVYDEDGKLVATGELEQGRTTTEEKVSPFDNSACMFPISVSEIPKGSKFYQVEVSHRGKVTVKNEPEDGKLFAFLTLGS